MWWLILVVNLTTLSSWAYLWDISWLDHLWWKSHSKHGPYLLALTLTTNSPISCFWDIIFLMLEPIFGGIPSKIKGQQLSRKPPGLQHQIRATEIPTLKNKQLPGSWAFHQVTAIVSLPRPQPVNHYNKSLLNIYSVNSFPLENPD